MYTLNFRRAVKVQSFSEARFPVFILFVLHTNVVRNGCHTYKFIR